MADLTAPRRYGEKVMDQLEKFPTADIADTDREKLLEERLDWSEVPARCWMLTDPDGYPDPSR